VDRRRFILETTRELIRRIEQTPDRAALIADLKEWSGSMQPQGRRVTQASINQAAGRGLIQDALAKKINFGSTRDALLGLKASERLLSGAPRANRLKVVTIHSHMTCGRLCCSGITLR
jgi:hypothetical protein